MYGREMTRIMLEGALNGIGFVIGSAVVGWIFLHGSAILACGSRNRAVADFPKWPPSQSSARAGQD